MTPLMLPIMLNKLKKRLDNTTDDLLKEHGLSKLHLLYLMALYENKDGLTLKELTEYLGFDKANTSRAISQLIEKGYVQKKAQGELELKYKVELTNDGSKVALVIWERNQKANESIIKLFTTEELMILSQIGTKLWEYLSTDERDK